MALTAKKGRHTTYFVQLLATPMPLNTIYFINTCLGYPICKRWRLLPKYVIDCIVRLTSACYCTRRRNGFLGCEGTLQRLLSNKDQRIASVLTSGRNIKIQKGLGITKPLKTLCLTFVCAMHLSPYLLRLFPWCSFCALLSHVALQFRLFPFRHGFVPESHILDHIQFFLASLPRSSPPFYHRSVPPKPIEASLLLLESKSSMLPCTRNNMILKQTNNFILLVCLNLESYHFSIYDDLSLPLF